MRAAIVVALAIIFTRTVAAQAPARSVAFDIRADGIITEGAGTAHLGFGVARRLSRNVGMQVVLGAGATMSGDGYSLASGRADVLARFAPAPSSANGWAAYASAGAGAIVYRESKGDGVLVVLLGVQKRRGFLEAGLGGGLRLGAGVRF
ncbi:MAG TPA: hypothetical protein VJ650_16025 [Gemmatimonadaceae bacterium]|nr:hypothetical protein [Gemmatimonadaceae bacterium]